MHSMGRLWNKWTCHDLLIFSLPARLDASQGGSCCVKTIAVLHLTADGCTSHIDHTYSYNDWRLALAVQKKSDVICKYVTCNRLCTFRPSHKSPQHRFGHPIEGTPANSVFKLTKLTIETLSYFQWRPRNPICSWFSTVHTRYTRPATG